MPILPNKILIDGLGKKDKIAKSIYKRFGNGAGILIAGEDPMAIPRSASSSKRRVPHILIADENPATLEFFSRLLEDRGDATMTTDSGEAVLQSLRDLGEQFGERFGHIVSVVLLGDLMKPPIDGLDLIRRLRPYHIPIVVATSYGADYALLAKQAGAKVIIHKFADPTYVITTIEQALQERTLLRIPRR